MSWTTVCDLPFTSYQSTLALDATSFHNNAQLMGSIAPQRTYVTFQHPDDQVVIPVKDESLQRFTCLNVEAAIFPTPSTHRLNIVEGWMSFALIIEADRRLIGSIYDGHNWVMVTSGSTLVPFNQWSSVSFPYDGVCIGRLMLNGTNVGSNINMPTGMRQPHQNITIGHWPSGDSRYTFTGHIGHVRIERRDYEDFWRDTMQNMLCHRKLAPRQVAAMRELIAITRSLDPITLESLRECAMARSEKLLQFFHGLRAGNMRAIAVQRQLGDRLRGAWCCGPDVLSIKHSLLDFFRSQAGQPESPERAQFMSALNGFLEISTMCNRTGPPFDRMRELLLIIIPELAFMQVELEQLIEHI